MKRMLKSHLTSHQAMRELSTMAALCFLAVLSVATATASRMAPPLHSYSEVEKLGHACPNMDSCVQKRAGSRELFSIKERNCACDYLCPYHGDCCIDAPLDKMQLGDYRRDMHTSCHDLRQFGGVYMKDRCPAEFSGPQSVRELCEGNATDLMADPLGALPVTDSVSGVTFKNYYCAMCQGGGVASDGNLVLWTPRLECPTLTIYNNSKKNLTHEYVFQNLETDGNGWGLYLDGDNGSLFFHDCDIDPVMPSLLENRIRLCKTDLIADCPENWPDDLTRDMCRSYMGVRYLQGDRYRNVHCALCNGVNMTYMSCQAPEYREIHFFRAFERHSFSLLLDINENMGQEVGTVRKCKDGDIFDPFFKRCRSLSCLAGYARIGDECVSTKHTLGEMSTESVPHVITIGNNTGELDDGDSRSYLVDGLPPSHENGSGGIESADNGSGIIDSENMSGITYNLSALDLNGLHQNDIGKFQNCLLISLVVEDYVVLSNKSIYVPKYDKTYEPTNYRSHDGSVLVCSHLEENDERFVPMMGYVTVIGLGVSMFCLLLHFIAFCVVPDLQNLSGKNLVSQCISLFCAYACFIIGQFEILDFGWCTTISFLTFYFFQVSFFWMSTMAYDVWRTLKMATTELRVSGGRQWKRFAFYTFYSWVTPMFVIVIAALAEYTDAFPEIYRPGFAQPHCWFKRRRALLVFFAAPLIVIMVANVALFASSARMIVMTTKTTIRQQSQSHRRNFKLYLRLALLMGLTWVIGLVASHADVEALWYLFVVMNTLQGFFVFVAFSCSTKVLNYFASRFEKYAKAHEFKSSSSHSASTGSNTHSTNLHSNCQRISSSKLLVNQKNSASPTNSSVSISSSSQPGGCF